MVWNEKLKREIPEGWHCGNLFEIANFTNGLACQKFRPKAGETPLPVIKIREMRDGFTTDTEEVTPNIPDSVKVVIIRMRLVNFMDQSGLYAMETAIKDLQTKGIRVFMTIIQPQPKYMLQKMNVIPSLIPESDTFDTFEDCTKQLMIMREAGEL